MIDENSKDFTVDDIIAYFRQLGYCEKGITNVLEMYLDYFCDETEWKSSLADIKEMAELEHMNETLRVVADGYETCCSPYTYHEYPSREEILKQIEETKKKFSAGETE